MRIVPPVENLYVLFLFFLHAYLVKLRLEYHILVEFLIGAHEWLSEVLVHHVLNPNACNISEAFALSLRVRKLLLDIFQLNVIEIRLNFELEFILGTNDELPHRMLRTALIWIEQEVCIYCFIGLSANYDGW